MSRMLTWGATAALLAVATVGCRRGGGMDVHPRLSARGADLQAQWSVALRNLGVHPVFPVREDVQVGDIYFSRVQPDEENRLLKARGHVPLDLFVARLDLAKDVNTHYQERYLFPETKAFNAGQGSLDRSHFEGQGEPGDRRMMRLVAFPAFASVAVGRNLQGPELYPFVPPEVIGFFQRHGVWDRVEHCSVGASMAESYGLPVDTVYRRFQKTYAENQDMGQLLNALREIGAPYREDDGLRSVREALEGPDKEKVRYSYNYYVKLITEVYTVRTLDIVLRTDRRNQLVDGYGGLLPFEGLNLERVNKLLERNPAAASSGSTVRFVAYGQDSVSLRRVFARPMVVGYRGVLIRINGIDKSAEMIGTIDSKPHLNQS